MRSLEIKAESGKSRLLIGESISRLSDYVDLSRALIISDSKVLSLHKEKLPSCKIVELEGGEDVKTLNWVEYLYSKFMEFELDRSNYVVALGGGTMCDLVGFATATYLRGLHSIFIPTTLLAQVDASVGGKNGVDYKGFKNLIGTIRQPEIVLCDYDFLKTLPLRDLICGFAEIVKHAVIADGSYFEFLEKNRKEALSLEAPAIERCICDSLVIKSSIVEEDEKESGHRMKLNFGHSIGHAVELELNLQHGEAVSIGMVAECELSCKRGCLSRRDAERVRSLLASFGLPTELKGGPDSIKRALRKDKKKRNETIGITIVSELGSSVVEEVPVEEIERLIDDLFSRC